MRIGNITALCAACVAAALQSACFTGIESTPRITADELKRRHVTTTAEQKFLADITGEPPARWSAGKRFYVTDPKIRLIFTTASTGIDSLGGEVIEYLATDSVTVVNSHSGSELLFTHGGDTLRYRPGKDYSDLQQAAGLDIPFTVELSVVDSVCSRLAGKSLYVSTPLWYDPATLQPIKGLRHVVADICDVQPGTDDMPLKVVFTSPAYDSGHSRAAVLMTVGSGSRAVRNFDSLFAFDDPRGRYRNISDETWQLITNSMVAAGMTREECRLALGAPMQIISSSVTTTERWSYPDGVYLIFEDGLLSSFRQ